MLPAFVGAGAGVEQLVDGTVTVSKTGCTAGNLLMLADFDNADAGGGSWANFSTSVNIENLAGVTPGSTTWVNTSPKQIFMGRVVADGTVSRDHTAAGGVATIARIYEFSGVSPGVNTTEVWEASGESGPSTNTTILDRGVTTLGLHRLAFQLVNVRSSQVLPAFTGETGGDWTEAAQFNGTTLSQQLQIAPMTNVGTIDGGSATIVSAYWSVLGLALIPRTTSDYGTLAWIGA